MSIDNLLLFPNSKPNITIKQEVGHKLISHTMYVSISLLYLYSLSFIILIISDANASGSPKQTALLPCFPSLIFFVQSFTRDSCRSHLSTASGVYQLLWQLGGARNRCWTFIIYDGSSSFGA